MSDLDLRSSFGAPAWPLIDTNQLTSNSSPTITQQGHGGNPFQAHFESRDLTRAARPALSHPCPVCGGLADSRSDMGGTGNGSFTDITPFIPQGGFQNWATQQAVGAEALQPIIYPESVPALDPNPVRSVHTFWA